VERDVFYLIYGNKSVSLPSTPKHGLCPQVKCPDGSWCLSNVKASETLA